MINPFEKKSILHTSDDGLDLGALPNYDLIVFDQPTIGYGNYDWTLPLAADWENRAIRIKVASSWATAYGIILTLHQAEQGGEETATNKRIFMGGGSDPKRFWSIYDGFDFCILSDGYYWNIIYLTNMGYAT